MGGRFGFIIAILTALIAAPPAKAQRGLEPTGVWLTQAGDAKVRVSKCGAQRKPVASKTPLSGHKRESRSYAR